jgi:hypothetical protein
VPSSNLCSRSCHSLGYTQRVGVAIAFSAHSPTVAELHIRSRLEVVVFGYKIRRCVIDPRSAWSRPTPIDGPLSGTSMLFCRRRQAIGAKLFFVRSRGS